MTDAKRIAKLEAQVATLRTRLASRTDQLLLVLLQIEDVKAKAAAWDALRAGLFPSEARVLAQMDALVHPAPDDSTC